MTLVLAGDIGGTNTRLALFDGALALVAQRTYPSREHEDFLGLLRAFVVDVGARPDAASFGIAGPVRDGRCKATNLPWVVDSRELARELGLGRAGLVNDLEANAWGIPAVPEERLVTLHEGAADPLGNGALIAAGTGLGEAGLHRDERGLHPFATEGGHADFAPRDDDEIDLLRWLRPRHHGRASWERVLSGPGLASLHAFLLETGRASERPELLDEMAAGDRSAVIGREGVAGTSEACVRAVEWFASLYGSEAGNLALKMLATGGVWVGGGIAPKLLPVLGRGGFARSFVAKGRMSSLLEATPVRVITDDQTALKGAARHALASLGLD